MTNELLTCRLPKAYTQYKLHLVLKKFWGGKTERGLVSLQVQFFCEKAPQDRTPSKFQPVNFEAYDKEKHEKELCEACMKEIRATLSRA